MGLWCSFVKNQTFSFLFWIIIGPRQRLLNIFLSLFFAPRCLTKSNKLFQILHRSTKKGLYLLAHGIICLVLYIFTIVHFFWHPRYSLPVLLIKYFDYKIMTTSSESWYNTNNHANSSIYVVNWIWLSKKQTTRND